MQSAMHQLGCASPPSTRLPTSAAQVGGQSGQAEAGGAHPLDALDAGLLLWRGPTLNGVDAPGHHAGVAGPGSRRASGQPCHVPPHALAVEVRANPEANGSPAAMNRNNARGQGRG